MKVLAVILLALTTLARADTVLGVPHYGRDTDVMTPRDRVYGIWVCRTALKEGAFADDLRRKADAAFEAANQELIPLWRDAALNPAAADESNRKGAAAWSRLEAVIQKILSPAQLDQLRERVIITFTQQLI